MSRIRVVAYKVELLKLIGSEWVRVSVGYLSPNPIRKGVQVWVGSLSSRDGYSTTPVTKVVNVKNIEESVYFETESGSMYLVTPLNK
jgi:hypothetical protein